MQYDVFFLGIQFTSFTALSHGVFLMNVGNHIFYSILTRETLTGYSTLPKDHIFATSVIFIKVIKAKVIRSEKTNIKKNWKLWFSRLLFSIRFHVQSIATRQRPRHSFPNAGVLGVDTPNVQVNFRNPLTLTLGNFPHSTISHARGNLKRNWATEKLN